MINLPEMRDYKSDKKNFKLTIPEIYNFGFDVIERRAKEANKTAFIYIDRSGKKVEHHSFQNLNQASNQFAHVLLNIGAKKGDFALLITPRIPAWYQTVIRCIKTGVVAMPGTNLLTANDIKYRINKSRAKLVIVTEEHASKIEEIREDCPSLEHLILIDNEREGWISYEKACQEQSEELIHFRLAA